MQERSEEQILSRLLELDNGGQAERRVELAGERYLSLLHDPDTGRGYALQHGPTAPRAPRDPRAPTPSSTDRSRRPHKPPTSTGGGRTLRRGRGPRVEPTPRGT